jgi:hypothetical protein
MGKKIKLLVGIGVLAITVGSAGVLAAQEVPPPVAENDRGNDFTDYGAWGLLGLIGLGGLAGLMRPDNERIGRADYRGGRGNPASPTT